MSFLATVSRSNCLVYVLTSLISSALAFQSAGPGPGSIGFPDGYESAFAQAGRNPNDTGSVTFLGPTGEDWTWRVNISNVAIPDSNNVAANAQYDLQWPGGGSLESYLSQLQEEEDDETELCAYFSIFTLPQNITSQYMESDNGNCSAVLGEQCARSLFSGLLGPSCRAGPVDGLDECENTLNVRPGFTTAYVLGNSTSSISSTTNPEQAANQSLHSGEAIFHMTSEPLPAGNLSAYQEAAGNLYLLALSGPATNGRAFRTLMCQVVNSTAAADVSTASSTRGLGGLAWILVIFGLFVVVV